MKYVSYYLMIVSLICFSALVKAAEAPNIRPGMWEVTVIADGVPADQQVTKASDCITSEQVNHPNRFVPSDRQCEFKEKNLQGNLFSWEAYCADKNGAQKAINSGKMTFKGDSYEGTVKISDGSTNMSIKIDARRVGDCK